MALRVDWKDRDGCVDGGDGGGGGCWAHPDIEGLEEKSLFSKLHQDWAAPDTLEALAEVNEAQIIDAREIYRREMSRYRSQPQCPIVIDKLPLNLAYLFLMPLSLLILLRDPDHGSVR